MSHIGAVGGPKCPESTSLNVEQATKTSNSGMKETSAVPGQERQISPREAGARVSEHMVQGRIRAYEYHAQFAGDQQKVSSTLVTNAGSSPFRNKILDHMTRDNNPPLSQQERDTFLAAMSSFSDKQLKKMDQAGVRFWRDPKGMPPDVPAQQDKMDSPHYSPSSRVIRPKDGSNTIGEASLRHELSHAWDDISNEKRKLKDVSEINHKDPLKENELQIAEIEKRTQSPEMKSEEDRKISVNVDGKQKRMTIAEMREAALQRKPENNTKATFAQDFQKETEPFSSNVEFYASGYAAFHGTDQRLQARLLFLAPELYSYLENEAKQNGLKLPNRKQLDQLIAQEGTSIFAP